MLKLSTRKFNLNLLHSYSDEYKKHNIAHEMLRGTFLIGSAFKVLLLLIFYSRGLR